MERYQRAMVNILTRIASPRQMTCVSPQMSGFGSSQMSSPTGIHQNPSNLNMLCSTSLENSLTAKEPKRPKDQHASMFIAGNDRQLIIGTLWVDWRVWYLWRTMTLVWNLQIHSKIDRFTYTCRGEKSNVFCVLPCSSVTTCLDVFCWVDAITLCVLSLQVGMEAMPCAWKETWRVAARSRVTHSWATRSAREISRSSPWRFGASRTLFVRLPVLRLIRETCSFTAVFLHTQVCFLCKLL